MKRRYVVWAMVFVLIALIALLLVQGQRNADLVAAQVFATYERERDDRYTQSFATFYVEQTLTAIPR